MSREGEGSAGSTGGGPPGPKWDDGRNVDPLIGALEGEGAHQRATADRGHGEGTAPFDVWPLPASQDGQEREDPSYYDRPTLKQPVWKWYVPAYFAVGGAAGAAAVLGAAAQIADREGLHPLIKRARWMAALGGAAGTVLLILDLGRPSRFLHMVRVFRPTSPMNLGSWVLSTLAPAAVGSVAFSSPGGLTGVLGDLSGLVSGMAGVPLSGYTAVLLSNTAVPVWQQTRKALPPLFVASAMSAAASLLQLTNLPAREEDIVRRLAVLAAAGELAAGAAVERSAGQVERVARPLHEGRSGLLLKVAKACALGGLLANLLPRRWRGKRTLAAVLGTIGAVVVKFGITEAGKASAADPRATFHHQRAGLGAAEVTGRASVTAPS